jgi:hypothetical protein
MDQREELPTQLESDVDRQTKSLEGEAPSWTQDLQAEPGKVGLQAGACPKLSVDQEVAQREVPLRAAPDQRRSDAHAAGQLLQGDRARCLQLRALTRSRSQETEVDPRAGQEDRPGGHS